MNEGYNKPKNNFEKQRDEAALREKISKLPESIKEKLELWEEVIRTSGIDDTEAQTLISRLREAVGTVHGMNPEHFPSLKMNLKAIIWNSLSESDAIGVHAAFEKEAYGVQDQNISPEAEARYNLYAELKDDIEQLDYSDFS